MKRHKAVKYPLMEDALSQWFEANEAKFLMSGELLKIKEAFFLNRLYPNAGPFEFSNGWLDRFKSRFGIKSYRRFGESGSVDMAVIEQARPLLCELLDSYELRDIYNMDETGLFYRMQASNICTSAFYGLTTMQLEGRKQSKGRIIAAVATVMALIKCLSGLLESIKNLAVSEVSIIKIWGAFMRQTQKLG